eukprot:Em0004g1383a
MHWRTVSGLDEDGGQCKRLADISGTELGVQQASRFGFHGHITAKPDYFKRSECARGIRCTGQDSSGVSTNESKTERTMQTDAMVALERDSFILTAKRQLSL